MWHCDPGVQNCTVHSISVCCVSFYLCFPDQDILLRKLNWLFVRPHRLLVSTFSQFFSIVWFVFLSFCISVKDTSGRLTHGPGKPSPPKKKDPPPSPPPPRPPSLKLYSYPSLPSSSSSSFSCPSILNLYSLPTLLQLLLGLSCPSFPSFPASRGGGVLL